MILVQTDYDFSLELDGVLYTTYEFNLPIKSVADLRRVIVHGPYGSARTSETKCQEWLEAVDYITQNSALYYDTTGGNRGVEYWPEGEYNGTI